MDTDWPWSRQAPHLFQATRATQGAPHKALRATGHQALGTRARCQHVCCWCSQHPESGLPTRWGQTGKEQLLTTEQSLLGNWNRSDVFLWAMLMPVQCSLAVENQRWAHTAQGRERV